MFSYYRHHRSLEATVFKDGKRFDLGLYPIGAVKELRFDKPGLSRVFCNIHPGMAASE